MSLPNEFQSAVYRTYDEMITAIAQAWIWEDPAAAFAEATDAELAEECIRGWNLDERSGETQPEDWDDADSEMVEVEDSHMEINNYDATDLASGFADLRATYPEWRGDR